MKNIQNKLFALLFIALAFPHIGFSQEDLPFDLSYEINRVYKPFSVTRKQLNEAKSLVDLNRFYKPSWVKEYLSVEVLTSQKGATKTAHNKSHILSQEQKDLMQTADILSDISVNIRYIPDNTLTHNDIHEINYTFTIDPQNEAVYAGGQEELKQYLKTNAMDKTTAGNFTQYHLSAVKFTINEEGNVTDAHIFESSKDEEVDALFLETICNMPRWTPASYSNGIKAKQEFVFTAGDRNSCVVNLLNIRRN